MLRGKSKSMSGTLANSSLGKKAFQRKVVLQRVDVGDSQEVPHQHGYRRAPAAARRVELQRGFRVSQPHIYSHLPPQQDDVVVYEEEAGQVVPLDQAELVVQTFLNLGRNSTVPAFGGLVANLFQVALGSAPIRHRKVRELVSQVLGQVERATTQSDAVGVLHGFRTPLKQLGHILGMLEEELAVGTAPAVRVFQGGVVLDGHQAVLHTMAVADVIVDVARRHDADASLLRQVDEPPVAAGVSLHQVLLQFQEVVAPAK